jgi:hypothetical protein
MAGREHDLALGPHDERVMKGKPGHTEDDRVVAETSDIELDGFRMWTNLELNGQGFVGERAGRDGTSVDNFQVLGHGFLLETEVMSLDETDVDERGRGARVDHREGGKVGIANPKRNRESHKCDRIKVGNGIRIRIRRGRGNKRNTETLRAE